MSRRRQILVPAVLVGGVAATTLALFGSQADAAPSSTTTTQNISSTGKASNSGGSPGTLPAQGGNGTTTTTIVAPAGPGAQGLSGAVGGQSSASGTPYASPGTGGVAPAASSPYPASDLANGQKMFVQACSSCHGMRAEGSVRAPTLTGLGAATVDFWVSTGRMPLEVPTAQAVRKPPEFNTQQAREIAEYVASLAPGGPAIPNPDPAQGDLAKGGQLYRLNCSTCHQFTGEGGALSYGAFAPPLHQATPVQIAEAIRTGPGNMPRFGPKNISNQEVNDIIRYVQYIDHPNDHGGLHIGHVGPVTEGFIGIGIGVGLMMLAAFWIGDRA